MNTKMVVGLLFVSSLAGAANNNIKDTTNGSAGQVLVNSGPDLGTWTDASFLKGATGSTGAQGVQGVQGVQGIKGNTGNTGHNGTNGTDGANGVNGSNGAAGVAGSQGVQGSVGVAGTSGVAGSAGVAGVNGTNGKDVDPATVNNINRRLDKQADGMDKLQQTKLLMEQDVRLYDVQRLTIAAFNSYDLNAAHAFAQGLRVTVKIGTSYEERILTKQQDTLKEIKFAAFELSKQVAQAKAELTRINNLTYKTVVIQERVDATGHVSARKVITSGLE